MSGCFVLRANLGVSCCYSATLEQFEKQVRDRRGRESMDYDHLSGVNIGCHQAHVRTCLQAIRWTDNSHWGTEISRGVTAGLPSMEGVGFLLRKRWGSGRPSPIINIRRPSVPSPEITS